MVSFCEHGNELSGSIKDGEFLDRSSALPTSASGSYLKKRYAGQV
jgi:hypothetical protein